MSTTNRFYPVRERVFLLNKYQCVKKDSSLNDAIDSISIPTDREPIVHISTFKHPQTNSIICIQCGKILNSTNGIAAKFDPIQRKILYCHACSKMFARITTFMSHKKKHLSFRCPLCGMKKACNESLQRHLFTHFDLKPYSCPNCSRGWYRFLKFNKSFFRLVFSSIWYLPLIFGEV